MKAISTMANDCRDDPNINAFALPGGFIGVHTGLLEATRNEDELAGVLAHEVAHVTQRHIARAIHASQRQSIMTTAIMLGAISVGAWAMIFMTALTQGMVNEVLAAAPNQRVSITLAKSGVTPEELKRDFLPWKTELEQGGVEVRKDVVGAMVSRGRLLVGAPRPGLRG